MPRFKKIKFKDLKSGDVYKSLIDQKFRLIIKNTKKEIVFLHEGILYRYTEDYILDQIRNEKHEDVLKLSHANKRHKTWRHIKI